MDMYTYESQSQFHSAVNYDWKTNMHARVIQEKIQEEYPSLLKDTQWSSAPGQDTKRVSVD